MSDLAIRVDSLSKAYRIGLREEIPDTLLGAAKGVLSAPWRNLRRLRRLSTYGAATVDRPSSLTTDNCQLSTAPGGVDSCQLTVDSPAADTIWALRDVSFDVREGEVVGVIGRNGAGKSTLLKILSRITEPTRGRAELRGRVSSLLEAGTGFHPELTGRENMYLNGTILGMTKREIDRKFEEIVEFSGVEKFLDTAVKRYSSGMRVRLAFAVAAHLEPEILIIDEVLAVGDAEFQNKCVGKMRDVAGHGRTVLFVSHNMNAVQRLCTRAIYLADGSVTASGNVEEIIGKYLSLNSGALANQVVFPTDDTKDSQFIEAEIRQSGSTVEGGHSVLSHLPIEICFKYLVRVPTPGLYLAMYLRDANGLQILFSDIRDSITELDRLQKTGCHSFSVTIPARLLVPGRYSLTLGSSPHRGEQIDRQGDCCCFEVLDHRSVRASRPGIIGLPLTWSHSVNGYHRA